MKNGKPINLEARLKRLEADIKEIKHCCKTGKSQGAVVGKGSRHLRE